MENGTKVDQALLKLDSTIRQIKSDGVCQSAAIKEMDRIKNDFNEVLSGTTDRPSVNNKMIETALNASDALLEVSNDVQQRKCDHNEAHQRLYSIRTKLDEKKNMFLHVE